MANPSEAVSKGLDGVVAAQTRLSDVRGDSGELIYCGYDINELAGKVTYEEVVYLLHYNHLPNQRELDELKATGGGAGIAARGPGSAAGRSQRHPAHGCGAHGRFGAGLFRPGTG